MPNVLSKLSVHFLVDLCTNKHNVNIEAINMPPLCVHAIYVSISSTLYMAYLPSIISSHHVSHAVYTTGCNSVWLFRTKNRPYIWYNIIRIVAGPSYLSGITAICMGEINHAIIHGALNESKSVLDIFTLAMVKEPTVSWTTCLISLSCREIIWLFQGNQ